jgi:rubredoxin
MFNNPSRTACYMSLEREYECPECEGMHFWKTASMEVHLGTKIKWACDECGYEFIEIDDINTAGEVSVDSD